MDSRRDILQKIIAQKVHDIANDKAYMSDNKMRERAEQISTISTFYRDLHYNITHKKPAVIAEIKQSSPSKGILRKDFIPTDIARSYENCGATCLSILTDSTFFKGSNDHLTEVAMMTSLPILRKEFIIDTYQIYQAKVLGASAILLIAAILDTQQMREFMALATQLGMDTLIEVHNKAELDKVLPLDSQMIGINNRNLHNFSVSLTTTIQLLPYISDSIVITESGIMSKDDVTYMNTQGVYGFLVGEAFMREKNIASTYQRLFG